MTRAFRKIAVGLVVVLAGCAQTQQSGFLQDYSQLQPSPDVNAAMVYVNPARPLKDYNKFIIDPVVIHFAPEAKGAGIEPDTLKELTDHFRAEVVQALTKSGYQVVTAPDAGVMRIRVAITDISKTVPVANIHPAMKMSGIGLGGASMEAEGLDAQTQQRVFAVVDSQSGSRLGFVSGFQIYTHAKEVMTGWAERLVQRLDEAHGKKAKN
jgi:Protein of unknown function (DUF3313)